MKLTSTLSNAFKRRNVTKFSLCVFSSLLVSCANVNNKEAPVVMDKTVAGEVVQAPAKTESEIAQAKQADKLMATLSAPLQEPVSKSKSLPKRDIASKPTEAKHIGVQHVEAKPVTVLPKTEAPKVESNSVEAKQKIEGKKAVSNTKSAQMAAEKITEKEKAVAAVKQKVVLKKAGSKVVKPLAITRGDLPVSYDIWTIKSGETPLTQGLVISTPTWEMGATGYTSQIWLTLMEDKILVNSSSDVASAAGDLGIKIDGGELIPFTRIAENSIGVIDGQWLDKLAHAKLLEIYLGFFPDKKPLSQTFKSETSLKNLDRMVLTYRKLLK